MRNNSSYKIVEIGLVKIKMFNRAIKTVTDARHVLDLKRNLISLSTFDAKGYRYTSEGGVLKVSRCAFVVMKGKRSSTRLYILQGSTIIGMHPSALLPYEMKKLLNCSICG